MVSPNSNRNDPKMVLYRQQLTDIIAIFWQFHKERVIEGQTPFAISQRGNLFTLPMSPYYPKSYRVIERYGTAIRDSMRASWDQYHRGYGSPRFQDDYVRRLIDSIDELAPSQARGVVETARSTEDLIAVGINSGSSDTTQLVALFQEDFLPVQAVLASRVRIEEVKEMRRGIGSQISLKKGRKGYLRIATDYSLLDDSKLGLDVKKLRSYGVGEALGCPAGRLASAETQAFLLERGIDVRQTTMLEDFAAMTATYFDRDVLSWYRGLTPEQRRETIAEIDNKVLSGEARRGAVEIAAAAQCPYSGERR